MSRVTTVPDAPDVGSPPTRRRRLRAWLADQPEQKVSAAVLLGLGAAGFVGSAGHVLQLAESHGQQGTGAWTIVGTVEVLAAYAGWQVRRRFGWRRCVALVILAAATAFTVAANLAATSDHSLWGQIIAVTPAAVFIAAVLLAETAQPNEAILAAKAAVKNVARAGRRKATTGPAAPALMSDRAAAPVATGGSSVAVTPAVKPQAGPRMAAKGVAKLSVRAELAEAVLAIIRDRGQALAMGEIILSTGGSRSSVKNAVGDLVTDGRLVATGDPSRPRYEAAAVATEPARVAVGGDS